MNDQTALTVHDGTAQPAPIPKTPLIAGGAPKAIVPVDFDGAYRIANVVHRAGMAPSSLDTLEKVMVAILHGLEVGLTPMNALQSIAVINGRPTIWGDGAIGLIRASGLLEWMEEKFEGQEGTDGFKAVCIVKRKGEPKPVRGEFSVNDAKVSGLWTKRGRNGAPSPWQLYPKRMLQMRARWPLRDTFSDVLKGLSLREEVEDLERSQQPEQAQAEPEGDALADVPAPPTEEKAEPAKVEPTIAEQRAEAELAAIEAGEDDTFPGDKPAQKATTDAGDIPWHLDRKLSDNDRDLLMSLKEAFQQCHNSSEIHAEWETIALPAKDTVSAYLWTKLEALKDEHLEQCDA